MKLMRGFKTRNFAEADEFNKNSRHFYITDFWVNPKIASNRRFVHIVRTQRVQHKNDESRVFAKESREMERKTDISVEISLFGSKFYTPFSFVKADSEIIEDVSSADDMEPDSQTTGETYLSFEFMSSNRDRKLECKDFDERAITNLDEFFFAIFHFQTKNFSCTGFKDRITGTAVHKS